MEPKLNYRKDSKAKELNKAGPTLRPAIGTILGLLSNEPPWYERKGNRNKLAGRACVRGAGLYCGEAEPGINIGLGSSQKPLSLFLFSFWQPYLMWMTLWLTWRPWQHYMKMWVSKACRAGVFIFMSTLNINKSFVLFGSKDLSTAWKRSRHRDANLHLKEVFLTHTVVSVLVDPTATHKAETTDRP